MSESSPPLDFIQKSVTALCLNLVAHITNKACSRAHPPAILVLSGYRCEMAANEQEQERERRPNTEYRQCCFVYAN